MIGSTSIVVEERSPAADHGAQLKRGAWTNTIALLASNFRGVFTLLIARLLGPAVLGMFSVAWATTDLLTKIGMFALDSSVTTFIARAEAAGDRARSVSLFRVALLLAMGQCFAVALIAILLLRGFSRVLPIDPQMNAAVALMLCAMPGVALYRICTAVSRGMKIMAHDIYSRGVTETLVTLGAFLLALRLGRHQFAPQIGAMIGTAASGLVALALAASLFRDRKPPEHYFSKTEARRLLAFSAPITAYDLINALIVRLDVIVLACYIGRAPGVTLPVVGVYGAAVEVAGGLRKVNQIFNPIFAPVVAGLSVDREQTAAAAAFARVAQWMLWVLVPLTAVIILAAPLILSIYGPAFRQGSVWLAIIAIACGTNAFVGLAETVIMVQKPHLNLRNSIICCVVAIAGNVVLIARFGALGAAFGILLPYALFGLLRYRTLRHVLGWPNPFQNIRPPLSAALIAGLPAFAWRMLLHGLAAQIASALIFLAIFFACWWRHRAAIRSSALR